MRFAIYITFYIDNLVKPIWTNVKGLWCIYLYIYIVYTYVQVICIFIEREIEKVVVYIYIYKYMNMSTYNLLSCALLFWSQACRSGWR